MTYLFFFAGLILSAVGAELLVRAPRGWLFIRDFSMVVVAAGHYRKIKNQKAKIKKYK